MLRNFLRNFKDSKRASQVTKSTKTFVIYRWRRIKQRLRGNRRFVTLNEIYLEN